MTTPTAPADDITLPAPLQIDWPELNAQALGCGVEDRDLHDRYECAEYGWQDGVDRAAQCVPDDIYTSDMVREIVAADRASPSRAAWIDVAARLPESGKAVLPDIGKKTPIRAMWVLAKSLEASDEEGFGEYDEAADMYYCPAGWYEWNEHEETHWAVSATPLRWMTIPVPAAVDVGAAQAETAQAAPVAPAVVDLWYLQDTRSYVGNDVVWWAKDGKGYTTDLSKAHVYSRDAAFRQAAARGCDRAWPKAYIDGKTRPAVDMQYIDYDAALATPGATHGN